MTHDITIKKELLQTEIAELTLEQKGELAFDLHNAKAKIKELLEKIDEKQKELYNNISTSMPFETDVEGKLLSTQVFNKESGETVDILEWKQDKKEMLDITKTLSTLKASGYNVSSEILYEMILKTKEELRKILKGCGLSSEAVEDCFSKIKRGVPKLVIKKL